MDLRSPTVGTRGKQHRRGFKMRHLLYGVALWCGVAVANEKPTVFANVNKQGVILDGYDVVSYFKGNGAKPVKGTAQFQAQYEGVTYWFANAADRDEFNKSPQKYAPQFGGWCAYAVADSKSKVQVDYNNFLIQDGRLLLFYKSWILGDTRAKWSDPKGKGPKAFLETADANWPATKNTEP